MSAITHQVFFSLRHEPGSPAEQEFLTRSTEMLAQLPDVQDFRVVKQISDKADYAFGFSMRFADQDAYDRYNSHPEHAAYVENVWKAEVASFQELDSVAEGTTAERAGFAIPHL